MLLFESFNEIESICLKYGIWNYTINPDGTVDVDGDVDLEGMRLTKFPLKFGRVSGTFWCFNNKLTSLEGAPKEVIGGFYCHYNKLNSLKGSPKWVGGDFYCNGNELISFEGGPIEIKGYFSCEENPVYGIYELFPDYKSFRDSMDYGYLRGTDIIKSRFKEALEEIGVEMPESIEGYQYI